MKSALAAVALVLALAACSSGHSSGKPSASAGPSDSGPAPTVAPFISPGPTATSVAGVKAPVTPAQLGSAFGTTLTGPRAATNGQPTLLYGDVTSSTHLVVAISIYTPQMLAQQMTTPEDFYNQGEDPTAEHVTGIGQKAYLIQDQITVLTEHNYVLIVSANQQVREEQLKAAAKSAASKL
jgi:hypothetical protein